MKKHAFPHNSFNTLIPHTHGILFLASLFLLIPGVLAGQSAPTLREGDRMISTDLVNENGKPLNLAQPESPTVVTFIFTRCAVMEFCPRMNSQFETIQTQLREKGMRDARLVSITLDPEYDRPARLKEYGGEIGANPEIWNFGTGSREEIDRLTKAFRVYREKSGGVLNHALCTALITPDGTIAKIWRGNAWKPEMVIAELEK